MKGGKRKRKELSNDYKARPAVKVLYVQCTDVQYFPKADWCRNMQSARNMQGNMQ